MKPISAEREHILKSVFSDEACSAIEDLVQDTILLNQLNAKKTQDAFREDFRKYYEQHPETVGMIRLKKIRPQLPCSTLLFKDEPYLLLPTSAEWKKQKASGQALSNAVPKFLISLTTGKVYFLKTFRPQYPGDRYPHTKSINEYKNLQRWGRKVKHFERDSRTGLKSYILKDYLGVSLHDCKSDASITPRLILTALSQAASKLSIAHQKGELHLDIKPANIMYDAFTDTTELEDLEEAHPDQCILTKAIGTVNYMHPERLTNAHGYAEPISGKIICCKGDDVFSFLRTTEEMLESAIKKEYRASHKAILASALQAFRNKAYVQLNAKGEGTHARYLKDLPAIETLQNMLASTLQQYDNMALAAATNIMTGPQQPSPRPKPSQYQQQGYGYNQQPPANLHFQYQSPSPRLNGQPNNPSPHLQRPNQTKYW